jgi:enoyl-CoA hydratase/carnithine racemase
MAYQFLELGETRNAVARLTLRRESKKNALCMAMRDELEDAFARVRADAGVRALVIAGGDGIFCAGFDLKEGRESGGKSFLHRFGEFFRACYLLPKPMVAAVDGPALAGGFDLALSADFIVASTRAVFGHPEIAFGPVAILPLARFVSPARLRELCLLGTPIDAETAKAYGIVRRWSSWSTESSRPSGGEAGGEAAGRDRHQKRDRPFRARRDLTPTAAVAVLGGRSEAYDAYVDKKPMTETGA